MRNKHYESDDASFTADAYHIKGWEGIAFSVYGWETEPDEDTEWSGYENRTGQVMVCMIGDDRLIAVEEEDLEPLEDGEYCPDCGQIGCQCNVYA